MRNTEYRMLVTLSVIKCAHSLSQDVFFSVRDCATSSVREFVTIYLHDFLTISIRKFVTIPVRKFVTQSISECAIILVRKYVTLLSVSYRVVWLFLISSVGGFVALSIIESVFISTINSLI